MKRFLLALIICLFATTSWAAESCTQSLVGHGDYKVLNMVWVTDGSGNFTATATGYKINGIVMLVETVPTAAIKPDDNYDIVLNNDNSIDVMGGALANRDQTNAEQTQPLINGNYGAINVMGYLYLDVTNAGADNGGTVRIHYLSMD